MNTSIFQLFNKDITYLHLVASAGVFLFLTAIKYYMSGGVCKVSKDLTGKTAVITGGNTGIGRETALDLASKNCNLIIGARDKGKLQEVIKEIRKINPSIKAVYAVLDLADKESIFQFSKFVESNCENVDFLINNAGVMMIAERRETRDGLEMQMGINHFGHFYLTYLLFPLLKKSQKFRIINVSSLMHSFVGKEGINFEDIHRKKSYDEVKVYSQSKLANVYFTRLLQQKIDSAELNGIVTALHPGAVRTELTRDVKVFFKFLKKLLSPFYWLLFKNAKQGAQTTLYLVYEDEQKIKKGEYYADCAVTSSSQLSKDMNAAQKLWDISEETWRIKFVI